MSGLRPISLCFVFYKIITKTLSQRLKLVLPFILSPTQSAFVSKRLDHGLSNFSYTYYVLINDKPHGFIVPQRGLRQGDSLYSFLFVLYTEALIHLLNQSSALHTIFGIQFSDS